MNETSAISLLDLGLEEIRYEKSRYDLQETVCEGGMGKIIKAYDSMTDRYVAYKSVKKGCGYQFELRFRYEAEVTARLEHPNIMPVYDIGEDESGSPFYTMKLLNGKTLADQNNLSLRDTVDILLKVCDAIAFAHRNLIIHRDIQPENIIVGDFGEVLVLDWGIAKVLHSKDRFKENEELINLSSDLTQSGSVLGTPAYMAPEQADNSDCADQKSDIYSIGAVFYRLLSGAAPFKGSSSGEIIEKVKEGRIEECNSIPASALAVCRKAMELKPENRYDSVDELSRELQKLRDGFAVSAENASLFKVFALTCKRHKAVALTWAFFVAVMVGLLIWNVSSINEQKEIAEFNLEKAETALNDLKEASPIYLDRARHSIETGRFDDALIDIRTYLSLNGESKEAYFLLGRINQGQMKYNEAAKAFEKAQSIDSQPKIAMCASALHISKTAWGATTVDGDIAPDDRLAVYLSLVNNMQLPEAAALLDEILKNRNYSFKVYNALFSKSGLKGTLKFTKSGMLIMKLNKDNTDLSVLRHFRKAHFALLSIVDAPISDISVLSELNIRRLDISGTRVARLSQLKNARIEELIAARSRIQTLEDIKGRTFTELNLSQCPVKDIFHLDSMKVKKLDISGSPAANPGILSACFKYMEEATLPKGWKSKFSNIPAHLKVTWSDLEAPVIK